MVELLDLRIRNVAINEPLRLFACPNLQLLAKRVNIISIFWSTRKDFQRQNILARRYIHFKHGIGAPQGSIWRGTCVTEKVTHNVIEPVAWELVLASNCPYCCPEGLVMWRGRGIISIFEQYVYIIGRGSILNLGQHKCATHQAESDGVLY